MPKMRAKMKVSSIQSYEQQDGSVIEQLTFTAVYKDGGYPADGSDEDNTYAMFTPQAELKMVVNNPNLVGTFMVGQKYYVDFTKADQ